MSQYQPIHEKIEVAGTYKNAQFFPKKFGWQGKVIPIESITLVTNTKDGQARLRHYAVMAQGNVYRLCFYRDTEVWFLEEVWCE